MEPLSADFDFACDELSQLELSVARRADEIARTGRNQTLLNLQCWVTAEREVLCSRGLNSGEPRAAEMGWQESQWRRCDFE